MRLMMLFICVFTLWAGYTWHTQSGVLAEKKRELQKLQSDFRVVEREHEQLEYEVKRLKQDEEYIAELARKYYFLSKPGEIIFLTPE